MKLTKTQKAIIYGLVLGDGYLQPTGKKNARLRLECGGKNKFYLDWLYKQLNNLFSRPPKKISRRHPVSKRIYHYYRLQTHSSPFFGKLRQQFYPAGQKTIPANIQRLLRLGLTLAVWYMDDGYWYARDKSAHIYLPRLDKKNQERLLRALKKNFGLEAKIYCRPDRQSCQLNFVGQQKDRLFKIIKPYILPEFNYKLPSNPVSTESEKSV
jgi:hypothetical protein